MEKQTLVYNSQQDHYAGVQSDGTTVYIDGDAWAEALVQRQKDGQSFDQAWDEMTDPDGWSADMAGWLEVKRV